MQMGIHNTSMRHTGMDRDAMREAVQSHMTIGQSYMVKSKYETESKNGLVRCKLVSFSRTAAVFEHKNGTKESFTYQDICRMQTEDE